jgi:hypothetical protein
MAKSVACQSLGEMSTPNRAAAGLTQNLGFRRMEGETVYRYRWRSTKLGSSNRE